MSRNDIRCAPDMSPNLGVAGDGPYLADALEMPLSMAAGEEKTEVKERIERPTKTQVKQRIERVEKARPEHRREKEERANGGRSSRDGEEKPKVERSSREGEQKTEVERLNGEGEEDAEKTHKKPKKRRPNRERRERQEGQKTPEPETAGHGGAAEVATHASYAKVVGAMASAQVEQRGRVHGKEAVGEVVEVRGRGHAKKAAGEVVEEKPRVAVCSFNAPDLEKKKVTREEEEEEALILATSSLPTLAGLAGSGAAEVEVERPRIAICSFATAAEEVVVEEPRMAVCTFTSSENVTGDVDVDEVVDVEPRIAVCAVEELGASVADAGGVQETPDNNAVAEVGTVSSCKEELKDDEISLDAVTGFGETSYEVEEGEGDVGRTEDTSSDVVEESVRATDTPDIMDGVEEGVEAEETGDAPGAVAAKRKNKKKKAKSAASPKKADGKGVCACTGSRGVRHVYIRIPPAHA